MRKDSEGFHSHTVPWGSGQAAPEMSHVAGLGKLSQVFPGSEDRKDIPQGRSGIHKAWQPTRGLSIQGNG